MTHQLEKSAFHHKHGKALATSHATGAGWQGGAQIAPSQHLLELVGSFWRNRLMLKLLVLEKKQEKKNKQMKKCPKKPAFKKTQTNNTTTWVMCGSPACGPVAPGQGTSGGLCSAAVTGPILTGLACRCHQSAASPTMHPITLHRLSAHAICSSRHDVGLVCATPCASCC